MNTTVQEIIHELDGIEPTYWHNKQYTNLSEDYADKLRKALSCSMQTLFMNGRLSEANDVLVHVCIMTEQLSEYDYYQFLNDVMEDCIGYWRVVIRNSSPELREQLHEQFMDMADESRRYDDYNGKFDELLSEEFMDSRASLKRRLKDLDSLIRARGSMTGEYSTHRATGVGEAVAQKLDIMAKLGYPQEEMDAVFRQYWGCPEVRDRKVEMLLVQGDLEGCIQVLNDSRNLNRDDGITQVQNSATLIDLYQRLGRQDEYKKELLYYVFDAARGNRNAYTYKVHDSLINYIYRLEDACTPEEWAAYRERILQDKKFIEEWCPLMAKDGLCERLLNQILEWDSLQDMDKYEELLKPLFPEQMKKFYADYITKRGETAMSREHYAELMQYLVKLYHYPGGDKTALGIANMFRLKYPRRTAMKEELFKAGFR